MLLIALLAVAAFAAASTAAFYSYGRFAGHALGKPSQALPPAGPPTVLDRIISPLTDAHTGATGILLVDNNREAFELRALTARDAARSLDLQYYIWKDDQQGRLLTPRARAGCPLAPDRVAAVRRHRSTSRPEHGRETPGPRLA